MGRGGRAFGTHTFVAEDRRLHPATIALWGVRLWLAVALWGLRLWLAVAIDDRPMPRTRVTLIIEGNHRADEEGIRKRRARA
jgi:hypothetical protein